MSPDVRDAATFEDQDAVSVLQGADAMRGDQGRRWIRPMLQGRDQGLLRGVVDRGQHVIEEEETWLSQESPGQGGALTLSAGQHHPGLPHDGLDTARKGIEVRLERRETKRLLEALAVVGAHQDVGRNGLREQPGTLRHEDHRGAPSLEIDGAYVEPLGVNRVRWWVVQAGDAAEQGGLSRAGGPEDPEGRASVHVDRDVVENGFTVRIGKAQIADRQGG